MTLTALTLLGGCRAFEPEAVVVNIPPETYLVGAPLQGGGGYYHYHMFWYGSDEDGVVTKFVWALTDTSVQLEDTPDDEEDTRFNPALDISHLEIGHWTTKTDSIFDFQINEGTLTSVDMTFHMVAVDDYGDFDRTPARLHFFSNTLGTPEISFSRISGTDTIALAQGVPDTVGYGSPYTVYWEGSTPNVRGYTPETLALVDTIPPVDDGLFGYKWRLLGDGCNTSTTDCWHPRDFNEATGDSFSYFDEINSLTFYNNRPGAANPFLALLPSGMVELQINSLDVAGVEVLEDLRTFQLMVNYDPETRLLRHETDIYHPEDTQVYPYYVRLNDPNQTKIPFNEGERIPDRSYVVFKALARDNPADSQVDPDFQIGLTAQIRGVRENYSGGEFSFQSGASEINYEPAWGAGIDGWYADTLGFLVGPSSDFTFRMQAVDEHGRRDGTPPEFEFSVGFPPCVQCLELLPDVDGSSQFDDSLDCYDPLSTDPHPCFGDTAVFVVRHPLCTEPLQDGYHYLTSQGLSGYLALRRNSALTPQFFLEDPGTDNYYVYEVRFYTFQILLHGRDDLREAYDNPLWRTMAWRYQVDNECDPGNSILDGGGVDNLSSPTWGYNSTDPYIDVSPTDGIWTLDVNIMVPERLMTFPSLETFELVVRTTDTGGDQDLSTRIIKTLLRQFGDGLVSAIALDQGQCGLAPTRPAKYHIFKDVRPPAQSLNPGETWRDCSPGNYVSDIYSSLRLDRATMDSAVYEGNNLVPATKPFKLLFQNADGTFFTCSSALPWE
ncbi:hypothetical protein CSB20_14095 [bacterium DOLZORAL124_64_63]|nr:MAG: hypothetical protein CSB20_14095 [bacterium DOLZORAL124_64_63]